jgi:hypothetical protein
VGGGELGPAGLVLVLDVITEILCRRDHTIHRRQRTDLRILAARTLVRCRDASQTARGEPSSIEGDLDRIADLVIAAMNTSDS